VLYVSAAVSGLALGLLYGLVGFAIVMLYKSTGVANFAQGALGTLGAFFAFDLMRNAGWNLGLSIVGSLVASALVGVLCFLLVIRPRPSAGNLNITVRTLALSLLVVAVMTQHWGPGSPYTFPSVLNGTGLQVSRVTLSPQTLLIAAVSVAVVALFWVFFRYTRSGLSLRALAAEPDTARLLGLRTSRLGAATWAISCVIGSVVGILLAPTAFLEPTMMDSYLLFTFTGIVLGGLTSLPGALLGSVIVGIVANVTTVALSPEGGVIVVFGILLASMLLRPQGLLGKPQAVRL
jgi:branched-chain amino acid transport system permease protein